MRPQKLYAVRHPARRQATIVTTQPTPNRRQATRRKHPHLATAINIGKKTWIAFSTILAIVVSVATYIDQHRADTAASIASREAAAERVSVWTSDSHKETSVSIDNAAVTRILDVSINIYGMNLTGHEIHTSPVISVLIPEVSPCTIWTLNITHDALAIMTTGWIVVDDYASYSFIDSNGARWTRTVTGALQNKLLLTGARRSIVDSDGTSKPAAGCS